ncbi:MAG: hypothetical protein WDN67_01490 [Candidatus Moraniibacteriota bacterium]
MAEEYAAASSPESASPELKSPETSPQPEFSFENNPAQAPEKGAEAVSEKRDFGKLLDRIQSLPPAAAGQTVSDDAKTAASLDEGQRIEHLVSLAEAKGVPHAVSVARSLSDFYALDLMHDELAEKLHAVLDQGQQGV